MTGAFSTPHGFHRPVMVREVLSWLHLRPGIVVVDATVGGGGHAAEMLRAISEGGLLVGIDRDDDALLESEKKLRASGSNFKLVKGRMSEIGDILDAQGIGGVDAVLADLGVSSFQLDRPERGFSFLRDGPLDMRMDARSGTDAVGLIEKLDEEDLAKIIREYGEERHAGRIARRIFSLRGRIKTTKQLADAVAGAATGGRWMRIHPATRTFQALRIAVNDELDELEKFLSAAPERLKTGGRIAVISYHSLEDRMVKRAFKALAASGEFAPLVKKVVRPTDEETRSNPRARSAKMRVMERI